MRYREFFCDAKTFCRYVQSIVDVYASRYPARADEISAIQHALREAIRWENDSVGAARVHLEVGNMSRKIDAQIVLTEVIEPTGGIECFRQINGLPLPPTLIQALSDGTWNTANKKWTAVFPASELCGPQLYGARLMRLTNESWQHETQPVFVGVADGSAFPGALDPARSLLIGEVQGDAPIALDYRLDLHNPSVAFLNVKFRWAKVAASFDEFWGSLVGDGHQLNNHDDDT